MESMILFIAAFLFLLLAGAPIFFAMGGSAILFYFLEASFFIPDVPDTFFWGMNSAGLTAIPFFILAGEIMNSAGITDKIMAFANRLVGHFKGGMAYVNVLTSMLFAGISGVAISDAAALGKVFINSMDRDGYDTDFSAAVTAASSIQGPLIPPSVNAVVYASIMGLSVGGLFMAMLLPGVLVGVGDMIIIFFKRADMPKHESNFMFKELLKSFWGAFPALLMPIIVVGGILLGVFSPTEAGSIASFYGLILGVFFLKTLNVKKVIDCLKGTLKTTSSLLFLVGAATVLSRAVTLTGVPQLLVKLITGMTDSYYVAMFILLILFLFIGMWLNPGSALILFAPILYPIAQTFDVHPLLFGTFMILCLSIGLLTPPVGVCLYIVADIANRPFEKIVKATMPFIAINILLAIAIIFFPEIVLYIPRILGLI
ncbi:MAG: TRAP transporter large permease [Atribacterota bacterium]|nr:TRAP transporter large permease [Atribacterota bacterium]